MSKQKKPFQLLAAVMILRSFYSACVVFVTFASQAILVHAEPAPATNATEVLVTASSEESSRGNLVWDAIDGNNGTRWCANGLVLPSWWQIQFAKPTAFGTMKIVWETDGAYQYRLEGSRDGKSWQGISDGSKNTKPGPVEIPITNNNFSFLKVTILGCADGWPSIREATFTGVKAMTPRLSAADLLKAKNAALVRNAGSSYGSEGNLPPILMPMTKQLEDSVLKDVTVAQGFRATVFATPPALNYPVFLAAAPNGDIYLSSDGNGAVGRSGGRGRIIRLRDVDGDGHADEAKEFVKVDAPRGLVWDHDKLYVLHAPNLTVYEDKNGDGIADDPKGKDIVTGISFTLNDRTADHTTNGLRLAPDGYLYIANGDFGYMKATGTDGRTLQLRGGGVTRVRTDGTGLELYAKGTRNIVELAVSPTMEMFTRDNTNDGEGWNTRFHHIAGFGDHGYPRLFFNFPEEAIAPLADYGGGSGCGAVYLDEPGFGEWNNAPLTNDWETNGLYKHDVKRKGASFEEPAKPKQLIKLTRPTGVDVDARSNLYEASWKGAEVSWVGYNVGYIIRVSPVNFHADPLPDFPKLSNTDLVKIIAMPSQKRRLEAQRELIRRKLPDEAIPLLTTLMTDRSKPSNVRSMAALAFVSFPEKFATLLGNLTKLPPDPELDPITARIFAETSPYLARKNSGSFAIPAHWKTQSATLAQLVRSACASPDWKPEIRNEIFAAALASTDPVVEHMAFQGLGKLGDVPLALSFVDGKDAKVRDAALRGIALIHSTAAVDGVLARLGKVTDSTVKKQLISALARLYLHEGEWKGDSWGTRPDRTGPYYQPEPWSETPRIAAAFKILLTKASSDETSFILTTLSKNRVQTGDGIDKMIDLAMKDATNHRETATRLVNSEQIPQKAIPLLIKMATVEPSTLPPFKGFSQISNSVIALTRVDSPEGCTATLTALVNLEKTKDGKDKFKDATVDLGKALRAFLASPKLENYHLLLETEAAKVGSPTAVWADAALLALSTRTTGAPESRSESEKALANGWKNPERKVQILRAVGKSSFSPYAKKVFEAAKDSNGSVAQAAKEVIKLLELDESDSTGPMIGKMENAEIIAEVAKTKGRVILGEQVFQRSSCVNCHTVSESEVARGPYLGSIAHLYNRVQLAEHILDPNKSIAQGFPSHSVVGKDGLSVQLGFITFQSADKLTLRDGTGKETTFNKAYIKSNDEVPGVSVMPPGQVATLTMKEFASLLDYLEDLAK